MNAVYVRKQQLALFAKLVLHVSENGLTQSGRLASVLGVSSRYVEPELQKFVRAGILIGKRGSKGGYTLGRSLSRISLADIADAVWPSDVLVVSPRGPCGPVDEALSVIQAEHRKRLSSTTLASLTLPSVQDEAA